jgi:glycogen(starch) synthase
MHILLIASSYHPHKGGVETVVSDLAQGIQLHGDKVVVVSNLWPSTLPLIEIVDGVVVIRVPMTLPWARGGLLTVLKGLFTEGILTILVLLFRPSILNIQCVGPNGYWGKKLGHRFKIPVVVSTHGERTNDSSGFYSVSQNEDTYEDLIASAKAVICVSEVSAKESLGPYGFNPNNLVVIPNAIAVSEQPTVAGDRPVDITFVGRLVPEKGVDILIKSVANLSRDYPDLTVKIVGDGPSYEELNQLVGDYGLSDNVKFTGHLDRDAVNQVLLKSKILALPSRKESFGLVLLEAANAGCAVVASSTGGIPSIIEHGVNGLLFDIDSASQLEQHLSSLMTDEVSRLNLVNQFSNSLPSYDIKNFIRSYRTVFSDVAT